MFDFDLKIIKSEKNFPKEVFWFLNLGKNDKYIMASECRVLS